MIKIIIDNRFFYYIKFLSIKLALIICDGNLEKAINYLIMCDKNKNDNFEKDKK